LLLLLRGRRRVLDHQGLSRGRGVWGKRRKRRKKTIALSLSQLPVDLNHLSHQSLGLRAKNSVPLVNIHFFRHICKK
jgi:hypothetical protein